MAHVCQLDELIVRLAVVGDEGKNFWGDAVDRGESVFDGPNHAQNLQYILL